MRRGSPELRPVPPDMRYNSVQLQTLVQHVMKRGKKSTALRIIYEAMDLIKERCRKNPLEVFEAALRNVSPAMEVRPRRVGGATYQVPMEVGVRSAHHPGHTLDPRARPASAAGRSFADKLASELIDALNETGAAIRKRDETHKMAEANRAFSHYRI